MKKYFFLITVLFSQFSNSQLVDEKKIYLDSLKNQTNENNYFYYRIVKKNAAENYNVIDYFSSGKIAMTGYSLDDFAYKKNGEYVYFYENGNKCETINYDNNLQSGDYNSWYEDGSKKETGKHKIIDVKTKEIKYLTYNFWDKKNSQIVKDGNGFYENEDKNGFSKGKIVEGLKDSIWTGFDKNFKYKYEDNYEKGKFINGKSTDSKGIVREYDVIQKFPEPKRGLNDFYKFIGKNFNNPNIKGLSGRLILSFVIDTNGKIIEIKVVKKIGYGADEEGIRVLEKYSDWIPAKVRGINIRCSYTIPIMIQEPL